MTRRRHQLPRRRVTRLARLPRIAAVLLAVVCLGALAPVSSAHVERSSAGPTCTKTWQNGVNGSWSDGTKWSPPGVPTSSDNVCITVNGTYTVVAPGASIAGTLTTGGSSGAQTLALQGNCSVVASLTVGGDISNGSRATITVGNVGCSDNDTIDASGHTFTNQGTLDLPTNPGRETVKGVVANTGTLAVDGPATFTDTIVNSGTINDTGAITVGGDLQNQKTIAVGAGHTLQVNGSYTQQSKGVFVTSVDSLSSFGKLSVTGAAA